MRRRRGNQARRLRCPGCGGEHYAWNENTLCGPSLNDCNLKQRQESSALADILREQRLQRRGQA